MASNETFTFSTLRTLLLEITVKLSKCVCLCVF